MVKAVGFDSVDALIDATVPTAIRREAMDLGEYTKGFTESGILDKLKCAPCMPLQISYRCIHNSTLASSATRCCAWLFIGGPHDTLCKDVVC